MHHRTEDGVEVTSRGRLPTLELWLTDVAVQEGKVRWVYERR